MSTTIADRTAGLCDTPISLQLVERRLRQALGTQASIQSADVRVLGGGLGFMSKLFRLNIDWAPAEDQLPASVVVKVNGQSMVKFPTGENAKKHMESMEHLFDEETKRLRGNEDWSKFMVEQNRKEGLAMEYLGAYSAGHDADSALSVPRLYYWECEGVDGGSLTWIIMQDMTEGSALVNMADGMSLPQVYSAVAQLAACHAASLSFKDGWHDKLMGEQNPEELLGFIGVMKCITASLKELRPELVPLVDRMLPHFTIDSALKTFTSGINNGLPPVMVHGDLWIANILYNRQQGDGSQEAGDKLFTILDWATAHPGNGAEDIARLLLSSTTGSLRRQHTKQILAFYRQKFAEKLGTPAPFSQTQLEQAYDDCLPFVMMFTVFGVPMWINIPEIVHSDDPAVKAQRTAGMIDRARMLMEDYLAVYDK